jgi:hypothetical protein
MLVQQIKIKICCTFKSFGLKKFRHVYRYMRTYEHARCNKSKLKSVARMCTGTCGRTRVAACMIWGWTWRVLVSHRWVEQIFCKRGSRETDSARWQSAENTANNMGNSVYRFGCYTGSCGKHLKWCFACSACRLLRLWQKHASKPPVCFGLAAYSTGKLKKAQTNTLSASSSFLPSHPAIPAVPLAPTLHELLHPHPAGQAPLAAARRWAPQSPRSLPLTNRRRPRSSPHTATSGLLSVSPNGWGARRRGWQHGRLGSTQRRPAAGAAGGWGRETLFLPLPMGQASTFSWTSRQIGRQPGAMGGAVSLMGGQLQVTS